MIVIRRHALEHLFIDFGSFGISVGIVLFELQTRTNKDGYYVKTHVTSVIECSISEKNFCIMLSDVQIK